MRVAVGPEAGDILLESRGPPQPLGSLLRPRSPCLTGTKPDGDEQDCGDVSVHEQALVRVSIVR
jgi:hypothetical protein